MIGTLIMLLLVLLCLGDVCHPRRQTRGQARRKARTRDYLRRREEDDGWRRQVQWYREHDVQGWRW